MKKNRIKWGNIVLILLFVICAVDLLKSAFTLATSLASLTFIGVAIAFLELFTISNIGDYLYEQIK